MGWMKSDEMNGGQDKFGQSRMKLAPGMGATRFCCGVVARCCLAQKCLARSTSLVDVNGETASDKKRASHFLRPRTTPIVGFGFSSST